MRNRIRPSILDDAADFIRIKEQLALSTLSGRSTVGGFLLGTDLETYKKYISHGYCLTALSNDEIIGFGIALNDALFKSTDIWHRRHQIHGDLDLTQWTNRTLCYVEQLAILAGRSRLALQLAYHLVDGMFQTGHEVMITTTVSKPVINLAAIPLILAVGGRKVGQIDEEYPHIGPITSDIYIVEAAQFEERTQSNRLRNICEANMDILL